MERFDKMLLEASDDLVNYKFMKKSLQKVTPWEKIFVYIIVFFVLNTFKINFFEAKIFNTLNIFISLLATYFMIRATEICKMENRYFGFAFVSSVICFESKVVVYIINIFIPEFLPVTFVMEVINSIYFVFVLTALLNGLKSLIEQTDIETRVKEEFNSIIFLEILSIQMVIGVEMAVQRVISQKMGMCILAAVLILKTVVQIVCVSEVRNNMVYFGYNIKLSDVKLRKYICVAMFMQVIIVLVCGAMCEKNTNNKVYLKHNEQYISNEVLNEKEEDDIRNKLIEMGMEQGIADELLPDELVNYRNVEKLSHTSCKLHAKNVGADIVIHCYLVETSHDESFTKARILFYTEWDGKIQKNGSEIYLFGEVQKRSHYFGKVDSKDFVGISKSGTARKLVCGEVTSEFSGTTFGQYDVSYMINRYFEKNEVNCRSYLGRDYYFANEEIKSFELLYRITTTDDCLTEMVEMGLEYDAELQYNEEMPLTSHIFYWGSEEQENGGLS